MTSYQLKRICTNCEQILEDTLVRCSCGQHFRCEISDNGAICKSRNQLRFIPWTNRRETLVLYKVVCICEKHWQEWSQLNAEDQ